MFSLETVAGDMSSSCSFSGNQNSKHLEMEFVKSREFMGSDFFQQSPGLARYRSAPSSFLAALLDSPADNSSSGDESDAALFSAIWSGPRDLNHKIGGGGDDSQMQPQFHLKQEIGAEPGLTSYESPAAVSGGGTVVGSYSAGLETQVQVRLNSGNGISGSNLLRQSSSPAGFFNGFGVSSSHLAFSSSGASSSPRMMPSIPENGSIDDGCENGRPRNGNIRELEAAPFSHETWSDSSRINDMKRNRDGNLKMFSAFNEMQNQVHNASVDTVKSSASLVHHLNLPKSLNEKGEPEKFKFLQFQPDVVPCQIRAKRGCATHPRSIAERMRRTRISERMKKLQELFPNMDKQTSTADMLDMAVEYIKDLQRQVQTLSETKTKCVCSPPERNTGK